MKKNELKKLSLEELTNLKYAIIANAEKEDRLLTAKEKQDIEDVTFRALDIAPEPEINIG